MTAALHHVARRPRNPAARFIPGVLNSMLRAGRYSGSCRPPRVGFGGKPSVTEMSPYGLALYGLRVCFPRRRSKYRIAKTLVNTTEKWDSPHMSKKAFEKIMAGLHEAVEMAERANTFTAYMCKTDFEEDARAASDGARIYPSEAAVRRERKCTSECGIVEVTVTLSRVIQPSDWSDLI